MVTESERRTKKEKIEMQGRKREKKEKRKRSKENAKRAILSRDVLSSAMANRPIIFFPRGRVQLA